MNIIRLNTTADGFIKVGNTGGGGGTPINNQEKSVDITENGTTEVVADEGFTGLSKVVVNTNVQSGGGENSIIDDYFTIVWQGNSGRPYNKFNESVEVCLNGSGEWVSVGRNSQYPTLKKGDMMSIRANLTPTSNGGIGKFTHSYPHSVRGNAMSLLYGDNGKNVKTLDVPYAFKYLFQNNQGLVRVSDNLFPAKDLTGAKECYYGVFLGCTSLKNSTNFSATILEEGCYGSAYSGCTSLETAQDVLPSIALKKQCYDSMYQECTLLKVAPILPDASLEFKCYNMMFYNCSSLEFIKALTKTPLSSNYSNGWVYSVASAGVFVKNTLADWNETGYNGTPNGWTIEYADA